MTPDVGLTGEDTMKLQWAVIAVCVAGLCGVANANLLVNDGFESGDFTSWTPSGAAWRTSTWGGDLHSGLQGAVNDAGAGDEWRVLFQDVSVTAGLSYDASGWFKGVSIEAGKTESWLELQWLDSGNNIMWGQGSESAHLTADQDWSQMSLSGLVAPVGAAGASVRGVVHVIAAPVDTDFHVMDDFSLTQTIPEPTTLGLVGAAMAVVAAIRRRRA
jgi:hypothetical protein